MNATFSIRELAAIAFPTGIYEGTLIMLRAYFDDSGTHADAEITAIGGLIGSTAQWEEFERRWRALLECPMPGKPPLRKFHLSPCNARDGEFSDYRAGESDLLMHDFRKVLIDCELISTASAIDKRAWDEVVGGDNRVWLGDAVDVCVENCLTETIKIAGPHPQGEAVAVVFDRGIWTPRLKEITDGYTFPLGKPRISSVVFSNVEDVLPLQGADIVATENYWHAIRVLRDGIGAQPRPHMRHYLENMRAEGFLIDRERIAAMLPEIEAARLASGEQPS